jgi:hypothetical protein
MKMEAFTVLQPNFDPWCLEHYMGDKGYRLYQTAIFLCNGKVKFCRWKYGLDGPEACSYEDARACQTKSHQTYIAFTSAGQEAVHRIFQLGPVLIHVNMNIPA